ncbi:mannose-1-phosphate guanylyltransferase/mannose-6-phosphate isomerase [Campylobacter sp. LR264d]|uniref:mannose-1-phosphate guanylyltransferase/mannose-6-phosphate isomerase n=1 Tax=unclassified Campylobacter TaxID=2593542 RepID=UPI0012380A42|nr:MULTISPECIES: mannose-1-phosphate guanylyltransferase/mannose-6-phosphate isomerase [unclassified Campylobacter]KAA6224625.1 mannose-1-phosphate guanylyltransferase/mannose-6-phosphate isomerase [Campylobacter sp. LR185c]KAA6228014.1 mannose-1-phosphate guanylyltransferase/mannose-6-phosphate isomerase [Campylobacter sp. LR196d]KAA6234432.1 mannose-1-phosphate guanylyltransferase/mannose-6-phosphate isomerase [Campylobacter sp. LR264d]KAA8603573.1 mannose-1-phosphate guanylyltransferase/mann
MVNIILCGGSGTRLWPLSRTFMPKQFLQIFDNFSLFQLCFKRNLKLCDKTLIVSNISQYFLALDQINELNENSNTSYILEPFGKNTAPAISLACLSLNKDDIVLVTPSDHLIKDEEAYQKAVLKAKELAEQNFLVTFGITCDFVSTGYGYIKFKNENEVCGFFEKPDFQRAQEFVESKEYLFNSGMFAFKVGFFLEQMQKFAPDIYESSLNAFNNALKQENLVKIYEKDMQELPNLSIDYALMEKSSSIKVVKSDIRWSDVGSFESLSKEFKSDKNGNFNNAKGIFLDSYNNFVLANKKFIATIDINDLMIIDTDDALLIGKKESAQRVKEIYENIKNDDIGTTPITMHRPWGTYTTLEDEKGYKIKRIVVRPGKRLSLQKHFHRNEHWIVLSGTASVQVEDEIRLVRPNESIYVKMGHTHRLSNEGKIPVVLIEVQVGEYTKEDDIVRIEDDFNRGKL